MIFKNTSKNEIILNWIWVIKSWDLLIVPDNVWNMLLTNPCPDLELVKEKETEKEEVEETEIPKKTKSKN